MCPLVAHDDRVQTLQHCDGRGGASVHHAAQPILQLYCLLCVFKAGCVCLWAVSFHQMLLFWCHAFFKNDVLSKLQALKLSVNYQQQGSCVKTMTWTKTPFEAVERLRWCIWPVRCAFVPVWVLVCFWRSPEVLKDLWQFSSWHLYGFSPVCVREWLFSPYPLSQTIMLS